MLVKEVFKPSAIRFFTPFTPDKVADKDAVWLAREMFKSTFFKNPTKSQLDNLSDRILNDQPRLFEYGDDMRWSAEDMEWVLKEAYRW